MDTGHQALVLFYAFFWAAALNVTGRFQPFDTPSIMARDIKASRRLLVSFFVLNFFPVVWFIILYVNVIPDKRGWAPIAAAAAASLSVFGFHRILHAVIASEKTFHFFYTKEQVEVVRDRGEFFKQPQTFISHFIPGLSYLVLFGGAAWLIIRIFTQ